MKGKFYVGLRSEKRDMRPRSVVETTDQRTEDIYGKILDNG